MTSTPFTTSSSAQTTLATTGEGATISLESSTGSTRGQSDATAASSAELSSEPLATVNTSTFLTRVQQYAETGRVDVEGLSTVETAAFHHVLNRLHATFVKQFDCDEIKCDAARKCPKCGVARGDSKLPKSPKSPTDKPMSHLFMDTPRGHAPPSIFTAEPASPAAADAISAPAMVDVDMT
ncbi:unnamed protein product [Aphanomyces euteiches]|uniref:Uncharacterized protein n=1 Tax=Aphanomyces euteiches TaxID=100861 RepID=A0A6G0XXJ4_9STRA|nr:hypothetical protein Ae201684_000469 [Aphanomyces euteiches]KAH9091378.1 hypothetical protein Ae201684P_010927 [Aphanomyces euteiches]KAH9146008.1 hypothetical protein AeRB84_010120 [Aphanomyces euteiches]